MPQPKSPSAQDAGGLSGDTFPRKDRTPESNRRPARVQAKLAALKREFIAECLRIAAIKASHGADNVEIGDDLNAARDLRIAAEHIQEAARAFRELGGST